MVIFKKSHGNAKQAGSWRDSCWATPDGFGMIVKAILHYTSFARAGGANL